MTTVQRPLTGERAQLLRQRLRQGLNDRAARSGPVIPRRDDEEHPPLSFAQERLWFMDQLVPGTAAYTVPIAVRLRGALDVAALERALGAVIDRHETLRTRFLSTADGRPRAVVDPPGTVRIPLPRTELDPGLTEEQRIAEARALVAATAAAPFDLEHGPLIRAALIGLAADDHVLTVVLHHIAADGWSIDVFLGDLLRAYTGEPPAPPLTVRYGDYAAWQRSRYHGSVLADDLAYWTAALEGVPPLELPTDRPRPPQLRTDGAGLGFDFGPELAEAVARLGRDLGGATPYMVLLAAVEVLLCRWSGQDDFAIGSTVAGRNLPELEPVIGLFANVLALRADVAGDPSFAELVGRVRDRVLDAFAHQEMPFERLVAELRPPRDASRSPVFQATVTMLNYATVGTLPDVGLGIEPFPIDTRQTRFDLELYFFDPAGGRLHGFATYNSHLFEAATIERLVGHLELLLRAVVDDPHVPISRIPLLTPAERDLVLYGFNDTTVDIGVPRTLPELVSAQVRRTPDARAVTFEDRHLTYAELDRAAARLARRLRAVGVRPGSIVAVCVPRSLELVVALYAVLKAGGAYLPLDPEYPRDRLAFMLADAAPAALLVAPEAVAALPEAACPTIDVTGCATAAPAEDAGEELAEDGGATPDDIAYVIYTSGSTGRPKGVPNTHRGIHNRLDWMQRRFQLGPDDVVLQKTPAAFDVSVWEFFWPLLTGARLVLARPGGHKDAEYLRDLIIREGVTTVHFVPSMLTAFLATDGVERCRSLRRVISSGEALPVPVARSALQRLGCPLHNLYGPTEAAIDVTAWECRPELLEGRARVPIGRPIQNIRIYILDRAGQPTPIGVPGELHIAGVGLAVGYLNRPGLTAERFRPDPFGAPGERMYATGDLARFTPDGTIEYLGRLDQQVKLRGARIELGEIESVLREQDGVVDAAVTVREDRPGDQRLVAYLVTRTDLRPQDLRAALGRILPDYMVPAAYVTLPALPLTPSGKLDRRALPAPAVPTGDPDAFVAPRTEVEAAIAGVWAEVLGLPRVGIDDDFFTLGGHSLLATQVVAKLRTALPPGTGPVTVMDIFQHPTVRRLAELAATPREQRGPQRLLHELTRPAPGEATTLTFICVPYGGGSAVVYQYLADALPPGYRLFALAIPGHDLGVEEQHVALDNLVRDVVAEVKERIDGPIAVYGHCAIGGAVAVALGRALTAAGREVTAVYAGGIFPFARPKGRFAKLRTRLERLRSDRLYANWLTSLGLDLTDIPPEHVRTLVRNLRRDNEAAEEYFTALLEQGVERLPVPIISVVGERDDMTMYYEERYREWHFLTDRTALVVLDEAGHYFLKYRAAELAAILTVPADRMVDAAADVAPRTPTATWWRHGVSIMDDTEPAVRRAPAPGRASVPHRVDRVDPVTEGPPPSMRRFLTVAASQLVSMTGSAMTEFAVPLWIYLQTGSLVNLALFSAISLVPGMLVLPFAGVIVDRFSRRAVMLASDGAAGTVQALLLGLVLTGRLQIWHIYALLSVLSVALTFQRLAYSSAIPQLVPKRYLGHANGMVQVGVGVAQFLVPVAAVGLLTAIGLHGILIFDVASYVVAVTVLAIVRFPALLAYRRREPMLQEIRTGFRLAMGSAGLRSMLFFFASINIFLGPALILVQPLVLGFGTERTVTQVAVAGGLGTITGAVIMALWGGPARRKMRGVLACATGFGLAAAFAGVHPSLPVVALGVFAMFVGLTVMNSIYATIVQVKIPARYHGRVFAVNTLFAFCTLPLGFVVVGPAVSAALTPLLEPGGALAGTVGQVIGVGPGRGIGLAYIVFGLAIVALVAAALRYPPLANFDRDVPDAEPDDLVGIAALRQRGLAVPLGGSASRAKV